MQRLKHWLYTCIHNPLSLNIHSNFHPSSVGIFWGHSWHRGTGNMNNRNIKYLFWQVMHDLPVMRTLQPEDKGRFNSNLSLWNYLFFVYLWIWIIIQHSLSLISIERFEPLLTSAEYISNIPVLALPTSPTHHGSLAPLSASSTGETKCNEYWQWDWDSCCYQHWGVHVCWNNLLQSLR